MPHGRGEWFFVNVAASVNAGLNLELSYGMRNNVFMHIPKALAMGNITLEVGGEEPCAQTAPCPKRDWDFDAGVLADAA